MNITDTSTNDRRAMCADVKPRPAIARVVRQLADAMRQPLSIAFALQKRGLCADWNEASRVVLKYYPWP